MKIENRTIGIEIESFLTNEQGDPLNIDSQASFKQEIATWLEKNNLPEFSREPSSDTLELKTLPMKGGEIRPTLEKMYYTKDIARKSGLDLLFAGVNPNSNFNTFNLVDTPYFQQLTTEDFLGSVSCNTASIHVNLFLAENEKHMMFPLIYSLQEWIWPITVIMQSSPIYDNKFTNYMAGRQILWDLINTGRTGLVPEGLNSWNDFDSYRKHILKDGIVDKVTKIWWDIRPKPIDGGYLIEVRFADSSDLDITIEYIQLVSSIFNTLIERINNNQSIALFENRLCLSQTRENILRHGRNAKVMLDIRKDSLTLQEWCEKSLSPLNESAANKFYNLLQKQTVAEKLLSTYNK